MNTAAINCLDPVWSGLALASQAVHLPSHTLLHAGPPYADPDDVPLPVRNSAMLAAIFEGWADDVESAAALIASGGIEFRPSAEFAVLTPLAHTVSPNMWLQLVVDRQSGTQHRFAPINGGMKHDLRFGQSDPETLNQLHTINQFIAPALAEHFMDPIELIPIADFALSQDDDCHGRTSAASGRIAEMLAQRLSLPASVVDFVADADSFFLNLWMAASRLMLQSIPSENTSRITMMAGNGRCFGIQIAAKPGCWYTITAEPPQMSHDDPRALGAIGDSPVVEAFGLGGMLRNHLPKLHPGFVMVPVHTGLTATNVLESGESPTINLGVLDRHGDAGLIGRGIYRPAIDVFQQACDAVSISAHKN